ncbi:hypothetical protein PT974_11342 [Cladobotryum mycophilum]|uniref:Uncharacterized protein n=1 Tax=Cladobotryum mycophilum TaxID=491253 RepID=A0ABR0S4X9_9HYPO
MNPFPSTPTPRRFLLSKRSTQSSQTPAAAPPRFTSTPRFGSSSVPRPTQSKELDIEDDDDDDEEGEEDEKSGYGSLREEEEEEEGARRRAKRGHVNDAMDIESDGMTASQEGSESPGDRGMGAHGEIVIDSSENEAEGEEEDSPWGREAKRRKMSISPAPAPSSPREEGGQDEVPREDEYAPIQGVSIEKVEDGLSALSASTSQQSLEDVQDTKMLQQPVFHPAPRFKPVEIDEAFEEEGAKYIAGGLAAELQGWLSEVKGWEGNDQQADTLSLRIYVDEVRPGKRMYLAKGHVASGDTSRRRFVLAGEGKLTGLGRRAEVKSSWTGADSSCHVEGDEHIGISLQTLDHKEFDHGTILAQTPAPGLPLPESASIQDLTKALGVAGAQMLVQGLRDGVHVPPHVDAGWMARQLAGGALVHAPKVTKADSQVDWTRWTTRDFQRRMRVFGAVWTRGVNAKGEVKRVILQDAEGVAGEEVDGVDGTLALVHGSGEKGEATGERYERVLRVDDAAGVVHVQASDGGWMRVRRVKVDGKPEQAAASGLRPFITKFNG